jgi:eukaryotic-like serine/threonine-protein kinase
MSADVPKAPERGSSGAPHLRPDPTLQQGAAELAGIAARALRPPEPPPPGRSPGYTLEQKLGSGAFGEVWAAREDATGRRVAVKFFTRKDKNPAAVLQWEVEKLWAVQQERRVVHLYAVARDATPPYFVMEYADRGSLEKRHLPEADSEAAARLAWDVAEALASLHGRGLIHCDLKPSNILVDATGGIRLADFGQARSIGETGPLAGTLFYMAPELSDPAVSPDIPSDVYSWGAFLYALLAGAPPYASDQTRSELDAAPTARDKFERYAAIVRQSPPPRGHRQRADVDKVLAGIIDRCLQPNPKDRFQSITSVLDALELRSRLRARRPAVTAAAAVLCVLLVFMGALDFWTRRSAAARAEEVLSEQILDSNRTHATLLSLTVGDTLAAVAEKVTDTAGAPELTSLMERVAPSSGDSASVSKALGTILERLPRAAMPGAAPPGIVMPECRTGHRKDPYYSWVVADPTGRLLARAPADSTVVGGNFSWRMWFNGIEDRPRSENDSNQLPLLPRSKAGWTAPFVSQASGNPLLVSFGAPIGPLVRGNPLGVLAGTVHVNWFSCLVREYESFSSIGSCPERFGVLLGPDERLLRHPCMAKTLDQARDLQALHALASPNGKRSSVHYRDPMAGGEYIAVYRPIPDASGGGTPWGVIVQHSRASAMQPIAGVGTISLVTIVLLALGLGVILLFVEVLVRPSASSSSPWAVRTVHVLAHVLLRTETRSR